ncbi:MAG TPA: UPF0280 family protein [Methanomassiliicoccales archaeon]|nr:UPF0280 family protein [Methanomassiliicoccales archaeon]
MRRHFQYKETAVTIEADEEYLPLAEKAVLDAREEVEAYIAKDPYFKATFDPYPVRADMGEVVRHMCEAAQRADVGPMAAVAGAIGHHAVAAMTKAGCKHCLVDNGGDIVMRTNRTVTVGLYSSVRTPNYLALEVPATKAPYSICTSSGTVGPSISLGRADLATVIAADGALADACATKLGNLITEDDLTLIDRAIREVLAIEGVKGALVMIAGKLGLGGEVPWLVRCDVPPELITRVRY